MPVLDANVALFQVEPRVRADREAVERMRSAEAESFRILTRLTHEARIQQAIRELRNAELRAARLHTRIVHGRSEEGESSTRARSFLSRFWSRVSDASPLMSKTVLKDVVVEWAKTTQEIEVLRAYYERLLDEYGEALLGSAEATARSIELTVDPPVTLPLAATAGSTQAFPRPRAVE